MPIQEINSNFIFTDGEVISFKVNYQVPVKDGFESGARIRIKAKHALPKEKFEYCLLELNFTSMISLFISEDFGTENKISNMTLKKLEDGIFYIALYPYNDLNEPDVKDNFVIRARGFSFDLLRN